MRQTSVLLVLALAAPAPVQADGVERLYQANKITMRQSPADAGTLYALLVCDVDTDSKIGPAVEKDLLKMQAFLDANMKGRTERFKPTVFTKDKATPDKIRDYYARLESKPPDALFFYYAGHGGADTSKVVGQSPREGARALADSHYLALKRGNLLRSDLRKAMEDRPHQLVLILTDCCGNRVAMAGRGPGSDVVWAAAQVEAPARAEFQRETFDSLFLRSRGVIDISAASIPGHSGNRDKITAVDEGQATVCTKELGGIFTHVFLELMTQPPAQLTQKSKYPDESWVDWFQMFGKLQRATEYYRLGMYDSAFTGVNPKDRQAVIKRLEEISAKVAAYGHQRPYFFKLSGD